jgi:CDP-paratose 2-epimerase
MRALITGACGFVGATLANRLLKSRENLEIIGIDNLIRPGSEINRRKLQDAGLRFIHADIRNSSDINDLPKVDLIIDAAANPSVLAGLTGNCGARQLYEHNCFGTINLLEYCRRHKSCFVMLSTSRVYSITELCNIPFYISNNRLTPKPDANLIPGFSENGLLENFSTSPPISLYGATKLASETLAIEYGMTFDFPVWINRCGVLAGAGQFGRPDQGIFSYWINSWQKRLPLKYIGFSGKGLQVRDVMHPADLVPIILSQFENPNNENRSPINISGGLRSSISLAELSIWCEQRFGPHNVESDLNERKFDIPWIVLDNKLAMHTWNWNPSLTKEEIFEEIALHAETNPDWMKISSAT